MTLATHRHRHRPTPPLPPSSAPGPARAAGRPAARAVREPRPRRQRAVPGRGPRRGRRAAALVRQRAPRRRVRLAGVHRGSTSRRATVVRRFVGARADDAVVFTRNTTDALNLLARGLPPATAVVALRHRAPRRPAAVARDARPGCPPQRPADALACSTRRCASCPTGPRLVAVTGASNVTGELWPVRRARRGRPRARRPGRARRRPARPAPPGRHPRAGRRLRRPVRPQALRTVRRRRAGRPRGLAAGGRAVPGRRRRERSWSPTGTHLAVSWSTGPERHEAGTPERGRGARAGGGVRDVRPALGRGARARAGAARPGCARAWPAWPASARAVTCSAADRVGVVSFAVGRSRRGPAGGGAVGRARHRRAGRRVLRAHRDPAAARAAGASGTGRCARASAWAAPPSTWTVSSRRCARLVADGPAWHYAQVDGRWAPTPDPRPLPPFVSR